MILSSAVDQLVQVIAISTSILPFLKMLLIDVFIIYFLSDLQTKHSFLIRRVQRYQRGNHNPYIEEQTRQWPKEKVQKGNNDLQNITHKPKDRRYQI
jgi:hypothetical protein